MIENLTEQEIVAKWADILLKTSNYKNEISIQSFALDWQSSDKPPTDKEIEEWNNNEAKKIRDEVIDELGDTKGNLDVTIKRLIKYLDLVKTFLLNNGYIEEKRPGEQFWRLTEKGKLAKELGGHLQYLKYRNRELYSARRQQKHDYKLAFVTALLTLATGAILWLLDNRSKHQETQGIYQRLEKVERLLHIPSSSKNG